MRALRSGRYDDIWWDLYADMMAADRLLYPPSQQHQGAFFHMAFEGHGIDAALRDFCNEGSGYGSGSCNCRGTYAACGF